MKDGALSLDALYDGLFAVVGDQGWGRLNQLRLEAREKLAAALAAKDSTVIECGAFLGHDTALLASAVGPGGRVIAFDGCPVTAAQREEALGPLVTAGQPVVQAISRVVYDGRHDLVAACCSAERPGHTVVHHEAQRAIRAFGPGGLAIAVPAMALDDLDIENLGNVSLLWLDVSGSAPAILAGARRILSRYRPAVVFDYAHVEHFANAIDWPLSMFRELGYDVYDFTGWRMTEQADFQALKCWNLMAHPAERPLSAAVAGVLAGFNAALGAGTRGFKGVSGEEQFRSVELVSLKTAARADGLLLGEKALAQPAFDIFKRAPETGPEMVRLARFPRLGVTTGTAWKPFTPDGLYMEELGYTLKARPDRVRYWEGLEGRWTIEAPKPHITVENDGRPIFLLGGDGAYYHWILNWMPRLMVFDEFREVLGDIGGYRFIVSAGLGPACLRGLELLGIRSDQLIVPPFVSTVFMNDVVVPSFFNSFRLSPNVADWYRRRLAPSPRKRGRRLYISRNDLNPGGPPRRRVINENEIAGVLESFGFEIVRLAELSFDEQMQIFSEAEAVIGPHGAGFANLVFTPPGAKVLVFENSWNHTFMYEMARTVGHAAKSIVCDDVVEKSEVQSDIADTEKVRNRDMTISQNSLYHALSSLLD